MILGLSLLAGIVLLLLAGALPGIAGSGRAIYHSPVFLGLVAAATVAMLLGMRNLLRSPRTWAAVAAHLALAVLLIGAAIDYRYEVSGALAVPLVHGHELSRVEAHGRPVVLPFRVAVTQVDVDYYLPEYELFRPASGPTDTAPAAPVRVRLSPTGLLDLGAAGRLPAAELRDAGGNWLRELRLPDGSLLRQRPPTVRNYHAALRLTGASGPAREASLSVNRPLHHEGWSLYLTNVGDTAPRVVTLTARRAPGRPLVVAGIWLLLATTAAACFAGNGGPRATR
jgi:hypothetical protein